MRLRCILVSFKDTFKGYFKTVTWGDVTVYVSLFSGAMNRLYDGTWGKWHYSLSGCDIFMFESFWPFQWTYHMSRLSNDLQHCEISGRKDKSPHGLEILISRDLCHQVLFTDTCSHLTCLPWRVDSKQRTQKFWLHRSNLCIVSGTEMPLSRASRGSAGCWFDSLWGWWSQLV